MKTFYHFLVVLLIPLFLAYSSSSVYAEEKITPYTPEEIFLFFWRIPHHLFMQKKRLLLIHPKK